MKNLGAFRSSLFGHCTLTEKGPQTSVSIIGGLVEPDVVSVEQPTIRETEAFGLVYGSQLRLGDINIIKTLSPSPLG